MRPHHQEYFYKPISDYLDRVLPSPVVWRVAFKVVLVALVAYCLLG